MHLSVVVRREVPVIFEPSQFTFLFGEINQMQKSLRFSYPFLILIFISFLISVHAQEFRRVADGIEYAELVIESPAGPIRGNLLKLDPSKVRLEVMHAMDSAIGVERTSSIASRHGAIAAVNAGFFRLDTSLWAGEAAGIMKIDGRVISESYGGRAALGFEVRNGRVHAVIDRVNTEIELVGSKGGKLKVDGINRERKEGEIVVFTKEFGRSTLTSANGTELVVDERSGRVIFSRKGGSSPIEPGTFVVSFTSDRVQDVDSFLRSQLRRARLNFVVNPANKENADDFNKATDIVGGVGYILKNGKVLIDWNSEKTSKSFYETRHPRTAFAILGDGKYLLATIDGRQPEHSIGVGLEELATILKNLGAVEVINLDGGGSTAMFLDGKIVNKPSDKEGERRVGDALLVFPKK